MQSPALLGKEMTILLILTILIVAIALFLLLAPFYIEVDSRKNIYRIRFHRVAKIWIWATQESLFAELQLLGWHKQIDLLVKTEKKEFQKEKNEKKKSHGIPIRKVSAILQSFRLSSFTLSIDTGDMALNGLLYPWFLLIGRWMRKDIRVTFDNENEILFQIENNLYRLIRAYVTH